MAEKLIVKMQKGRLTLNGDPMLTGETEIKAEQMVEYLQKRIKERDDREEAAFYARAEKREDVTAELEGRVIDFRELERVLKYHQTTLRESWHEDKMLLYVGFGLNDGDMEFTANAEWK